MVSSSGGSGTVLLSVASFYGFELPLQLPIWKKQLGGPGGGGGGLLPITPHVKGCGRCTVAPGQEQHNSPRCPNRPAWSCRDLSGKQVCGVQGAGSPVARSYPGHPWERQALSQERGQGWPPLLCLQPRKYYLLGFAEKKN